MKNKVLLLLLLSAVVVVAGCTSQAPAANTEGELNAENDHIPDESMMVGRGYMLVNGSMMIEEDKKFSIMNTDAVLKDGTIVMANGVIKHTNGSTTKLGEGQSIWEDGSITEPGEKMMDKEGIMMEKDDGAMMTEIKYSGTVLAGSTAKLLDFNKADYEKALASDKYIVLYFYASWCPICVAEEPELRGAFNDISTDKVVGFRVNYNDGNTDSDEKSLAEQFQVPYQHYKIVLKDRKIVLKAPDTWNKARYISEINKLASN